MTWPLTYDDVPSKEWFPRTDTISNELLTSSMAMTSDSTEREPMVNFDFTEYKDGINVGYRHYCSKQKPVAYPFGYGLSYTKFKYGSPSVTVDAFGNIKVSLEVKNIGSMAGKEVVQVYVSAPGKDMGKPERELKAFLKSRCLEPSESQKITVTIPYADLASFNEAESQWQVEEGDYKVLVAKNASDAEPLVYVVHVNGGITEKVRPCLLEEQ